MDEGLQLRDLLDESDRLIAGVAADGRVLAWSRALAEALGWPQDQVPSVAAVAAPESRAALSGLLARAVGGELGVRGAIALTTRDGRRAPFTARLRRSGAGAWIVLEPQEERFHADLAGVLDASTSIGMIALDATGKITLFNGGAARIYGISPAEVLGRDATTVLPYDPAEAYARALELAAEFGRRVEGLDVYALRARERGADEQSWTVPRADGTRLSIECVVSPVRGPGGELTGYVSILRDLTEARRIAAVHERLDQRLRGTLHASLDSIVLGEAIRDAAGRIVDFEIVECNPRTEALSGRPRDALIGARLSGLAPRDVFEAYLAKYARVVASGETLDEELRIPTQTLPGARWVRHQAVRVGDGVAVTTRDISQPKFAEARLRDSEERLHLALEAAGDELWDWDIAASRVYFTRGRATATATYPATELDRAVHPDDRAAFHAGLQEHLSGETALFRCEYRVRAADGGHRWVLGRGRVVARDGEGRPRRLICTQTDISARKHQEDALRLAVAEAEAASQAKSEFLAHVSHEIRTPMNGILGMVELALRDDPEPRHAERLTVIQDSARSLLAVINDLLDVAKIEAGKLELMPVAFDLRAELRRTIEVLRPRAEQQGLRLELAIADGAPALVVGDPDRLRQVLVNLIGNAIKFTARGAVDVAVDVVDGGEPVGLRFTIRDTGIGIPPDRLAAIFAPFEQADPSTTRRFGGTGLGLTIASRLVDLMGGTITVTSELGVGSIFAFEAAFPRAHELAAAPATPPPTPRLDASRPLRILLAEDNRINQLVAAEMLERAGHLVTVVDDGAAAVEAIDRAQFDVVLMDVQMPSLDGWEATAAIRAHADPRARRLPIIAMTARATEADRARSLACGMNGFLTKPLQLAVLEGALAGVTVPHTHAVDDWDAVLDRVGGSRPLLARLIDMAREEAPMLAATLREVAAKDPEELRRTAHRAAGTAAMFSAGSAVALARALEGAATTAPEAERVAQAERVAEELGRLADALAAHRAELTDEPCA
jgi:PAS domain S-box-containing protein